RAYLHQPRHRLLRRRAADQGVVTAAAEVTLERREAVPLRRTAAGLWSDAWYRLRRDRVTMAALAVIVLLILVSLAAPIFEELVFRYKFDQQDLLHAYNPPTLDPIYYIFGADEIGRSQAVRLLYGGRVSLGVGFAAASLQLTIGVGLGLAAGYLRGRIAELVIFVITVLNSIPQIFLLLIVASLFAPGPLPLIGIISVLGWTQITNFVRGQTLSLREREFITAAKTIGATTPRVLFRHLLPNVMPLIIVLAAIDVGTIVLLASAVLAGCRPGVTAPSPSPASLGGVLRVAIPGEVTTLDPWNADAAALVATRQVFETLVAFAPESYQLVPGLAESWQGSPDGLRWTFTLRV